MTVIVVMGVCGTGKSTIGLKLAEALGWPFIEGDDHHPARNREKMAAGKPLDNDDRRDWIASLCAAASAHPGGCVVSCSALNPTVRGWLGAGIEGEVIYVHLTGAPNLIRARMAARPGHFMKADMLDSQLSALAPPDDAITADIAPPPDEIASHLLRELSARLGKSRARVP